MTGANPQDSRTPLILVADDEPHILHVLCFKLRSAGLEVITAENGQEALALALEHKPDLVITDLQMPFITGLELAQQLKANPATAQTPVLLLTARAFNMTQPALGENNIMGVISKPFSPREVLARVQELVAGQKNAAAA